MIMLCRCAFTVSRFLITFKKRSLMRLMSNKERERERERWERESFTSEIFQGITICCVKTVQVMSFLWSEYRKLRTRKGHIWSSFTQWLLLTTKHCLLNNKRSNPRCVAVFRDDFINQTLLETTFFMMLLKSSIWHSF